MKVVVDLMEKVKYSGGQYRTLSFLLAFFLPFHFMSLETVILNFLFYR